MGILCELFGFGTKRTRFEKQLRPARDPPEFKPGPLADTGILWVQFFRKLLIPQRVAADYTKEFVPPSCSTIRQQRREEKRVKKEKCKCCSKCPKRVRPKQMDSEHCKEFEDKVKAEGLCDPVELKGK